MHLATLTPELSSHAAEDGNYRAHAFEPFDESGLLGVPSRGDFEQNRLQQVLKEARNATSRR